MTRIKPIKFQRDHKSAYLMYRHNKIELAAGTEDEVFGWKKTYTLRNNGHQSNGYKYTRIDVVNRNIRLQYVGIQCFQYYEGEVLEVANTLIQQESELSELELRGESWEDMNPTNLYKLVHEYAMNATVDPVLPEPI